MSAQKNFFIERSAKPFIQQLLMVLVASYGLLMITLLLIVALRNALGIDATLAGLSILVFAIIAGVSTASIYKMLDSWLRVSYFVSEGSLVIKSDSRQHASSARNLGHLRKVSAANSYRLLSARDFGDVVLDFAKSGASERVTLKGVKDPNRIAQALGAYISNS